MNLTELIRRLQNTGDFKVGDHVEIVLEGYEGMTGVVIGLVELCEDGGWKDICEDSFHIHVGLDDQFKKPGFTQEYFAPDELKHI